MHKKDLVQDVMSRMQANDLASEAAARRVVDVMLESMRDALRRGESVTLPDFGTLEPVERAPQRHKVPGADECIVSPGFKTVRFKIGRRLRAELNGK